MSDFGGIPVIDDTNYVNSEIILDSDGKPFGKGWEPRPMADEGFAAPFPFPLIPQSDWKGMIEDGEKGKSFLSHLGDRAGIKRKNQRRTNYCWIHGPVSAMEYVRAAQNQPYVELSPASVGAPMTKYANANGDPAGVGGWGTRGLKYLSDVGCCSVATWPNNKINPALDTVASRAERQNYRVTEWWDVKTFAQVMTCLLMRIPVPVGLGWWGHLVLAVDPKYDSKTGQFGYLIDNSYGTDYGQNGRAILLGSRAIPNDACAPRVVLAA